MRHTPTSELTLADGRTLSWREHGDPDGTPVVHNHGGLLSALYAESAAQVASALGLRLISPNRPGIGASTTQPGRTLRTWADDVAALADHLGLDRFGALGWSAGGPYAVGCAAFLPDRVSQLVVVAGVGPLDTPEAVAALNPTDRRLTRLSQRRPAAARAVFRTSGLMGRLAPSLTGRGMGASLGGADRHLVRHLHGRVLGDSVAEGMHQPAGMVEEYLSWIRPWECEYGDVSCPTLVLRGEADPLVPESDARAMVEGIPGATFEAVPDAGHLFLLGDWPRVLRPFTGS